MPDLNKILQNVRRDAGLESEVSENRNGAEIIQEPLIQIEAEPLIESAGETYGKPIRVCFAGVGTCGVNIVMSLKKTQNSKNEMVDFVGINSDGGSIKRLEDFGFTKNIALSLGDSYYLGAGGDLEMARKLGEKHFDQFKERFDNVDLVLVVTGMGGGTGTGVAPLVAKAAKEVQDGKKNKLTIGVATIPSSMEADKRDFAKEGIEELKKYVDALIVIDTMNIFEVLEEENASADQADELIDSKFQVVLQSIMDTVSTYTKKNIDFADVCSCLDKCGEAIITSVEMDSGNIEDIKKSLEKAINDKLLIEHSNKVASRLLTYHFFDRQYSLKNHQMIDSEVKRLFGWTKCKDDIYRCVIENPPEGAVKYLKVSAAPDDAYKGKMKIIIMAGGFVERTGVASPAVPLQATQVMRTVSVQPTIRSVVAPPPMQPTRVMPAIPTQSMPVQSARQAPPAPLAQIQPTQILPVQQVQPVQIQPPQIQPIVPQSQIVNSPATEEFSIEKLLEGRGFSL